MQDGLPKYSQLQTQSNNDVTNMLSRQWLCVDAGNQATPSL